MDNLMEAHRNARKGKAWYRDVRMVDMKRDLYLGKIQEMLKNKTYEVSEYDIKHIIDNGKERVLYKLPYYPDRLIQWALMLQTSDILTNTLTHFTCSSIKGRGGKKASSLLTKYIDSKPNLYCLKCDIRKYYDNVNHVILKNQLRCKFKDNDILWLFDKIIDSFPDGTGIPIGSYTSQHFANLYLNKFDHWLKEDKDIKCYVRYMDDMVIIHGSKEFLHNLFLDCVEYLRENLKLEIKDNWQVFPVDIRGIDFVGYRHFPDFKLLRKSICINYKNRMNEAKDMIEHGKLNEHMWNSVQSYKGWIDNCNSYRLKEKYYAPIENDLELYYNSRSLHKGG